ncbi:cyclic nucleotide-binding domain-containing protein [Thermomicrobium sp. CFH 73360]|uniref:cyclic nucleotide-binding domain-containing protein n=1 Tax=Thermomicrobium sp. CFH 73360 TaxID=2951987 RepID=UPI002076A418|nr:cyclic nucleotide-binding domain-containing protein [Thermomicrobium sp. CFH 73360]MCM8745578.1 cyclic nucleotide-binding domain-containing protein [Thermomicrobium sp. CFH 73360]
MSDRELEEFLAVHPFTADLDESQRARLAKQARLAHYQPDEYLIQEGRPADAFYLIVQGLVSIELFVPGHGPRPLQTVEGGSAVGWSWMLAPSRWEFDARALERTTAVVFDAERLRALLLEDCCLGLRLVQRLLFLVTERLRAARLQLLDLYGPPRER